ncbi:MAG: hypothetical protein ACI8PB_002462 [Desulforhopalus sp.]|jgi:hypothetical protein
MSNEEIEFLSVAEAAQLVGAIQEEEDIEVENRQILTVYSKDNKELCWFDFAEVQNDIGNIEAGERKEAVHAYILQRIPAWVKEL